MSGVLATGLAPSDAQGDGVEDAVGEPLFEVGQPAAEDRGYARGDPGIRRQPVHIRP